MAAYQTLLTYYGNVMRVSPAAIKSVDAAALQALALQADAGQILLALAKQTLEKMAINTTSVANLA